MATKTEIYEFRKKEENDFYNVEDFNNNMDMMETALTEFDDSGTAEGVTSFPDMLAKLVTGNKLAVTLKNLKAGLQFVLHAGSIVNNCVTDNPNLPLSAAQGKALQDLITVLNNELKNTENIALTDPEKFLKQISNVADIYGTAIKIVDKNGNDRIIYSSNLASRDFYFRSVGLTKTSTGTYIEFIAADDKKYKLLVDDIL